MKHPKIERFPFAPRASRKALSLLEVMLAIAILGGAMVAIGELTRIGTRSAAAAREMTTAQFHCESKIAEVVAGIVPPESVGPVPMEVDPDWRYQIEAEPGAEDGIIMVRVTVEQDLDARKRPISFSITRWMLDPQRVLPTAATDTTGTSGTTSGGASGSSGAGAAGS